MLRSLATLVVLAALVPPAHAVSKLRACQQACGGLVDTCTQVNAALGLRNLHRVCRAAVLKRCKREGVAACQGFCGDGVRAAGEACDGSDLGGATCASLGFGRGTLLCTPGCGLDPGGCVPAECGNFVLEAGEECDGGDLGGTTCADLGFAGGSLACGGGCGFADRDCEGQPEPVTLPISLLGNRRDIWWTSFDAVPELVVTDAQSARVTRPDAYDRFWRTSVGGMLYTPGRDATLAEGGQRTTLTAPFVPLAGLQVRQAFTVYNQRPALRVLVTLQNPSGSPITVPVVVGGNLGSDASTTVEGTTSGDLLFDVADLWLVSSDGPTGLDAVNLLVFGGAGAAVAPAVATLATDEVSVAFDVTVPALDTRHLLLFSEVHPSAAAALGAVAGLVDPGALDAANLLGDLDAAARARIVNWAAP